MFEFYCYVNSLAVCYSTLLFEKHQRTVVPISSFPGSVNVKTCARIAEVFSMFFEVLMLENLQQTSRFLSRFLRVARIIF